MKLNVKRLILALTLALVAILALPQPAAATDMLIVSTSIPNWRGPTSTSMAPTVWLEIYVDQPFTDPTTGITIQSGAPESGVWYKRYACTTSTATDPDTSETITYLVIPAVKLVATTNTTIGTKDARYSAYIVDNTGRRIPYEGFSSFRLPASFGTAVPTTGTWQIVRSFNSGPFRPQYDLSYFSREETLRLISAGIATSGGLSTLNGLNGSSQTFTNDTNVAIVSGGTSHVITWLSELATGRGGTGLSTVTPNGVIYGNGTSPLGVTAQGAANSVLVANGGAPSFSQTPTINTSVTIGVASSQTGSIVLRNSTNAFTVTVQPGATSASWVWTLPTDDGSANGLLVTNGSGVSSWTNTPTTTSLTTTDLYVTGLTTGRVPYVGASDQILDDSNFLWDATNDRLSIGTTDQTYAINLANASYLSGRGAVAAAQVRAIGIATGTQVASAINSGYAIVDTPVNVDTVVLGPGNTALQHVYTEGGATALNPFRPLYERAGTGMHTHVGLSGAYNQSVNENNYHFSSIVSNLGTSPFVGVFAGAYGLGAGSQPFAFNGTVTAEAANVAMTGLEINLLTMEAGAPRAGVNGTGIALFAHQYSSGASSTYVYDRALYIANQNVYAKWRDGIEFSPTNDPFTRSLLFGDGTAADYVMSAAGGTYSIGINFYGSTFSGGAILMPNTALGLRGQDTGGTDRNLITLGTSNFADIGDNAATAGTRIYSGTSVPTIVMPIGTAGYAGYVGLNQTSPAASLHTTAVSRRALTGTWAVTNGNKVVLGTASTLYGTDTFASYDDEIAPGSTFTLDGTNIYTVRRVLNDDTIELDTTYAQSTTTGNTAYTDRPTFLIEGRNGDDWARSTGTATYTIRGDSTFADVRGMLQLQSRERPQHLISQGIHAFDLSGTVTVTSGSNVITGNAAARFWGENGLTGGANSLDDEVTAGQYVYVEGQTKLYQVLAVTAANTLTLTENYVGATTAGVNLWEGGYGYISSLEFGTGWRPLILQGGAAQSDVGGVLIGSTGISTSGAMLKVEGGGSKSSNHVGSEFNNLATSASSYQKISALYTSLGAWTGPAVGGFYQTIQASEGTGGDRTNYPIVALGGPVFIAPHSTQVTVPLPYGTIEPTASVDVYSYPSRTISIGADTVQTFGAGTATGTGTTWYTVGADDRLRPGDAVMFASDTEVYTVATVASNTSLTLSGGVYNGTPASGVQAYRDPMLFRFRNGYGTERLRLESSGFMKLTGTFVGNLETIASAAALPLGNGNVFVVTGNTAITSIGFDNLGRASDTTQIGRMVTLVWGPNGGDTFDVTDGAALQLAGGANITTFTTGDTLTLVTTDGTNWVEVARSDN